MNTLENEILTLLREKGDLSTNEIALELGWNTTRFVRLAIQRLMHDFKIHPVEPGKWRLWHG